MKHASAKYRLYPSEEQIRLLQIQFDASRFAYNFAVEKRKTFIGSEHPGERFEYWCSKQVPKFPEHHSQVLQQAVQDACRAYKNFFEKRAEAPKFKSKKNPRAACRFPQGVTLSFEADKIKLPKVGEVRCIVHRKMPGVMKSTTISRDSTGKYWASVLYALPEDFCQPKREVKEIVGIDVGIKTFAVTSNGKEFLGPKALIAGEKRIQRAQRMLSRRKKGSRNYGKARAKLARLHERVANVRKDFAHKLSTMLVKANSCLAIEDLNVEGMLQNHKLAKHISDAAWSSFKNMLLYKADWYGSEVLSIDQFSPSSKRCSACGAIYKELTLSERSWMCICGTIHDRDINAARNIAFYARSLYRGTHGNKTLGKSYEARGTKKDARVL